MQSANLLLLLGQFPVALRLCHLLCASDPESLGSRRGAEEDGRADGVQGACKALHHREVDAGGSVLRRLEALTRHPGLQRQHNEAQLLGTSLVFTHRPQRLVHVKVHCVRVDDARATEKWHLRAILWDKQE